MAQARLKIGADASQAKKAIKELNDEMGRVDAKGRKLKVGSKSADGMQARASTVAAEKASGLGDKLMGLAAIVGSTGAAMTAFNFALADAQKLRDMRTEASGKLDDWSDRGNALGYQGNTGISAAMALDEVLIKSGASPKLVERMVGAWAKNFGDLTDSDKSQLGITGMTGDAALVSIVQQFGSYSEQVQAAVSQLLGAGNAKGTLAIAFSALKDGANGDMGQMLADRKAFYSSKISQDMSDAAAYVEMKRIETENLKTIVSASNPLATRRDADLEQRAAIREAQAAAQKRGIISRGFDYVEGNVDNVIQWAAGEEGLKKTSYWAEQTAKGINKLADKLTSTQSEPPKAQ